MWTRRHHYQIQGRGLHTDHTEHTDSGEIQRNSNFCRSSLYPKMENETTDFADRTDG
jgi:hypothetical protein